MTPMIDVVMCLIIFYLLVGKLATSQNIKDLPKSGSGTMDASSRAVVVDILATQNASESPLSVDGVPGTPGNLEATLRLRAAGPGDQPEVRIRAGRELPYSRLAPVLAACRRAGLTSVRLVAERQP